MAENSKQKFIFSLYLLAFVVIMASIPKASANDESLPPDTLWEKTIGGSGIDKGYGVQQTSDGGFVTVGTKNEGPNARPTLIKVDNAGQIVWEQTYYIDGTGSGLDQTNDGGFVIVGTTGASGFLLKTDSRGYQVWSRIYYIDNGVNLYAVEQTLDGGFVLAGMRIIRESATNQLLIKTNQIGDKQWSQEYAGRGRNVSFSVHQLSSGGGYILAGVSSAIDTSSATLINTDAGGNLMWSKGYGGIEIAIGSEAEQTPDGGFMLVGEKWLNKSNPDVFLVKTNSAGLEQWSQTYGLPTKAERGFSLDLLSDGGVIIAGERNARWYDDPRDALVIRTDSVGNELWSQTYGQSDKDVARSIEQTSDGGFIMVGSTWVNTQNQDDIYLIRLASGVSNVWVDFSYNGPEQGTFDQPFNTVSEGVNEVASGGTVTMKAGTTSERPHIDKATTLKAFGGYVTIGR